MWSLKFLTGPKAGKEVLLSPGLVLMGRDESCQIVVADQGISKKHAQILVKENSISIEDLNSSNGTFIKGKKVQKQELKEGDRVALHEVLFEIRKKAAIQNYNPYAFNYPHPQNFPPPSSGADAEEKKNSFNFKDSFFRNITKLVKSYIQDVILPGVYRLAEWLEFRFVLTGFVVMFVVLVMVFSAFPLISILKSSVEQESRNNAENIAIYLAQMNRNYLKKGLKDAVHVEQALRRPGVKKALLISAIDGRILAPAELAHTYPKSPFIHKARKKDQKSIEKVGSSSIMAAVPINFYNPETGENSPRAYAIVDYDMNSLALGSDKVFSLIFQNLLIVCVIGFILLFFLINLVEFPIWSINKQLERALKDEKAPPISIRYQSQILSDLCSHINSAINQISLNRMIQQKPEEEDLLVEDRQNEMNNLVEIIGFPALAIHIEEESIASLNSNFSEQLGFSEILHQKISDLSDSSLKEHLLQLLDMGKNNPQELAFGEVHLNQMRLQSTCQFIKGNKNLAYAIVTFMSFDEEEVA